MATKKTKGTNWNNTDVSQMHTKDIKTKTGELSDEQIRKLIRAVQMEDENNLEESDASKKKGEEKEDEEKQQTNDADWNKVTVSEVYIRDIRKKTEEIKLNDEQIRRLIRIVQGDDKGNLSPEALDARNKVIEATLVHIEIRTRRYRYYNLPVGDLINEAAEKILSKAIWKYDTKLKCSFFTYADWYIAKAFDEAIRNNHAIKIPEKKMAELKKVLKAKMELEEVCSNPSVKMIADITGIEESRVMDCLSMNTEGVSTEKGISRGDEEMTVGDALKSDVACPDNSFERKELLRQIEELLSTLSEQDRKIIEWRFPNTEEEKMTYEAIGKQLGISDEAVRQRVQKIKQKLESKARKMGLEEYLHGTN